MTTESSTPAGEPTAPPETPPEPPKQDANAELRAHNDRLVDENKSYRNELLSIRLGDIGLSTEEGLGKAIAKEYDGELTADALSTYAATEYSYQGETQTDPPEVASAARVDQLNTASESVTPPPEPDRAAEITGKMNDPASGRKEASESIAVKMNQFAQEHLPQP